MVDRGFNSPKGIKGGGKVVDVTASLADGGTVDVGLGTIDHALVDAENNNPGTTLNLDSWDPAATTAPNVGVAAATVDGTAAGAANATAHDMTVVAFGE